MAFLLLLIVLLTGLFLIIMLCYIYFPNVFSNIIFIKPKELSDLISSGENIMVLDVRSPESFEDHRGHVPGAMNIPAWDMGKKVKAIEYELENYVYQPVAIICQSGLHSPGSARLLKKVGMKNVRVVKGGMKAWYKEKLPIEKR